MSISPPPIPVQPLGYASEYVDAPRPGSIIAIGVISIVLSILFGLSSLFALMMALGAAVGPTTSSTTSVSALAPAYQEGLGSGPRATLLSQISEIKTLSPTRRDVLDGFLAQQGQHIDPRLRALSDPQLVQKLVTQSGTTDEGFDYIVFTRGRLTLEDAKAVFEPWGTTDLITVDLSAADPKPGMLRFDPTGGRQPSGTTAVTTTARMIISNTSVVLQTVAGVLGGVLAILLLVAGILTVRVSRSGRKMHLWWAWLKIGTSVFAAIAAYVFWCEFIGQVNAASGQPNPATAAVGAGVMISVLGFGGAILYPIVVLIVMNLRSVKNYLSSVT